MKENFEKLLKDLHQVATKDEPTVEDVYGNVSEEVPRSLHVYNIFKHQREKRLIMEELHKRLQAIDEGEGVSGFTYGEEHTVDNWDKETGIGTCTLIDGEQVPITVGELLTGGLWGVSYSLDAEVPKHIKKQYIVAEAKRRILHSLNDQIRHKNAINKKMTMLYDPRPDIQPNTGGIVAERLVESFFEQMVIDFDLPLEMVEVDIFEDYERKIDFLIRVPNYARGVEVDQDYKKDVGVQLTVSHRGDILREKMRQVQEQLEHPIESTFPVDDLVLVGLPLQKCSNLFYDWEHQGKRPGGPTKLWNPEEKELVFRGVLKDIIPEEKINEFWQKINSASQNS